ncbi:flagellar assembly protein FliW [Nocardioides fonticola]|uniref:Flagellar assembly factor FliW n=1 Tax=Nocardioides fonticola TaxID=450363 RepID=A0ABP7XGS9_9ACTN
MPDDVPVIEFVHPMPGFDELVRFALVQLDDDGVLCALRSVEDPDVRFLVVPPHLFFPDYAPVLDDETVAELGIESADDVVLLVVLNATESLADTTANLLAPIVVNTAGRRAAQVILADTELPIRAPLIA